MIRLSGNLFTSGIIIDGVICSKSIWLRKVVFMVFFYYEYYEFNYALY